jgi:hypothetical protein
MPVYGAKIDYGEGIPSAWSTGTLGLAQAVDDVLKAYKQAKLEREALDWEREKRQRQREMWDVERQALAMKEPKADLGFLGEHFAGQKTSPEKAAEFYLRYTGKWGTPPAEGGPAVPLSMFFPGLPGTLKGGQAATFLSREGERLREQQEKQARAMNQVEIVSGLAEKALNNPNLRKLFPGSEESLPGASLGVGALAQYAPGYGSARAQLDQLKAAMMAAGKEQLGSIGPITEREWPILERQIAAINFQTPWPEVEDTIKKVLDLRRRAAEEQQRIARTGFSEYSTRKNMQSPATQQPKTQQANDYSRLWE